MNIIEPYTCIYVCISSFNMDVCFAELLLFSFSKNNIITLSHVTHFKKIFYNGLSDSFYAIYVHLGRS